jgi:hypothetical protein
VGSKFWKFRSVKLELGQDYLVHWGLKEPMICRFIKPTAKGYNFLNLETSECILKRHIYPQKKLNDHNYGTYFYINIFLNIKKHGEKRSIQGN